MEINVQCLIDEIEPCDLSTSRAESGDYAGKGSWNASLDAAKGRRLKGFDLDAAKRWAGEFGAWERDEIARWTLAETKALVLQYAAGDLRELKSLAPGEGLGDIDWKEAEALSEAGTCGGNLFVHENELWISLS